LAKIDMTARCTIGRAENCGALCLPVQEVSLSIFFAFVL
jgi:hypothetical protein